ncbi:MAG: sugar ABC transporter substrate-binding protein [Schaalia hyovaginalis]|uniref:sugar ABC transporter substrate-binding protein n=2 Tax=Schaalia hyovaginalis TaxID=29316 RepID=UPI0026F1F469|nr:sugar ABC transporter substrate-binding protein [Schaalia hyovaginalis]MCI7513215.1 sugar ABC transporter substrate-binding protein [Schaalia hyovaginalis]MDY3664523.1 sugar ABC transporter substrate-binding protein [Schaalia hyovaginalis]MDY4263049.1 sugar ABC transporter substrate-binding protein [Schaalia hyovaginalis]MDY5600500.1 sugar ABC transporter substrate-binding protein [Schaalia hyovaginalis]
MSVISTKRGRFSALGASALSFALILSACSGASPDPGAASDGGTVTIEMWDYLGQGVSNTAMEAAVAAFEKANPGYEVKRTSFAYGDLAKSIVQGGVGGAVPDLAVVDVVDNQNFAALGLVKDLTETEGSRSGEFHPGPWTSTQMDGKTYGLPLNSNNLGLYYNKALLDEAGVAVPTTWEELSAAAKATANGDVSGLAISAVKNEQGTFQFLPFVWQTGGDLEDYATSGAEALSFLKGMIDEGSVSSAVTNYSQEDARTQFTAGKVAMMMNGPWELQNLADVPFEWGVAPLPKGKEAATGLGGENVVVLQEGKQADAAVKLAEFLTSAEGAKIYCDESGQLSARPDLAGKLKLSSDDKLKVFEDQLAVAHARAYGKQYAKVSEAVQLSMQEALTGASTPEEAAKKAAGTIAALLESDK